MAAVPSVDNIFDDDVEITPLELATATDGIDVEDPAPPRRSRQPLFLADSDDDMDIDSIGAQQRNVIRPPSPHEIDIDEIFGDLGDFDDDLLRSKASERLDEDAMLLEAEALIRKKATLHEILPSSSPVRNTSEERDVGSKTKPGKKKSSKDTDGDENKARRRVMKLDENRLLGPSGFPQLIKMAKDFEIKGKGHEVRCVIFSYMQHSKPLFIGDGFK